MTGIARLSYTSDDDERRLGLFGLSTHLIHTALRPGLFRATNRTALALPSTPGTDIYHDTMEQFHLMLVERDWRIIYVDQQPRLVHPENLFCFTIASAENVADPDPRRWPRTRKGIATREALSPATEANDALFDVAGARKSDVVSSIAVPPLWLLLHERSDHGLKLELSRPAQPMTGSGVIAHWHDRIRIGFLPLDGNLTMFDRRPDDDDPIDVVVEPR